jgi:hypothetical protein
MFPILAGRWIILIFYFPQNLGFAYTHNYQPRIHPGLVIVNLFTYD